MFQNRKFNAGSSLIEVLVAVLVVGLVVTAVMLSITYSVKNSAEARYREVASQLAQDGMEVVVLRRQVDSWSTFYGISNNATYCATGTSLNTYTDACGAINNGTKRYSRRVQLVRSSSPVPNVTATVTVTWQSDSNVSQDVVIVQQFYERAI